MCEGHAEDMSVSASKSADAHPNSLSACFSERLIGQVIAAVEGFAPSHVWNLEKVWILEASGWPVTVRK
jgi:hypothetical protein